MKNALIELNITDQSQENYFIKEAFNTLRTNILFSGANVKSILVTSCQEHEGKTSVSVDLAVALSKANKTVLLVDADMRRSALLQRYAQNAETDMGLSYYLSGQCTLEDAVCKTSISGLDLLPCGIFPPNPAELCGSPLVKELMQSAKEKYDYVLVDTPPVGMVADAAVLAGACDGAVVVINAGTVSKDDVRDAVSMLEKSGCTVLGAVLNHAHAKRSKNGNHGYGQYGQYGTYTAPKTDKVNGKKKA